MNPTKLIIGQIFIVFAMVIAGVWAGTQWAAAMLGYQAELGAPWFIFAGFLVYPPQALFGWWYNFDAYAPHLFDNAGAFANTRVVSQERYEARVLAGLRERLLDPDAVAIFVREYHEESARRDREDGKLRSKLQRRIAQASGRIERMVDAIAEGAGTFTYFRDRMYAARSERDACEEELAPWRVSA